MYHLARIGYFKKVAFYKVDGEGILFGIHGNPEVSAAWRDAKIRDEPPKRPNDRGYVAFTKTGPHTRWAPLVIHLKNNRSLDQVGYAPIGKVVEGMSVLDTLAKRPGFEGSPPDPVKLQTMGDAYLKPSFPQIESIKSTAVQ